VSTLSFFTTINESIEVKLRIFFKLESPMKQIKDLKSDLLGGFGIRVRTAHFWNFLK